MLGRDAERAGVLQEGDLLAGQQLLAHAHVGPALFDRGAQQLERGGAALQHRKQATTGVQLAAADGVE